MLEQLFTAIVELANKAHTSDVQTLWDHARTRTVLIDGDIDTIDKPPVPFEHAFGDLPSLVAAVTRFSDPAKSALFHSPAGIVCLCDIDDRHDSVSMRLAHSDEFARLTSLEKAFDHQAFVRLLFHDLRKAGGSVLLPKVRKLKVTSQQSSDRQHGREQGTAEYAAELAGVDEIPETVLLSLPVYSFAGCKNVTIEMSLQVDLQRHSFTFLPLPDELTRAIEDTHAWLQTHLAEALEGSECAVFYGEPG